MGNAGSDSQFFTLSNIADPLQSTGHVLRYTLREGNEGTNPVGFQIILRQGTTVIATFTHAQGTLPTTFTLFQQTLTNVQADSITDYNNLELTLIGSCTTGCGNSPAQRERVAVSWVEFAIVTSISPPTLNAVNVVNNTALNPVWTQPLDTSNIVSYEIQRNNGLGFVAVKTVPVGTTSTIDNGLIPDTFYQYRIVSVSPSGNSIPSNVIGATTTSVSLAPKIARPDSDSGLRWVGTVGCSGITTYQCVDDIVRDDTDYIQTVGLGSSNSDSQFYTLSNIADPFQSTGHVLRYTLKDTFQGTNQPRFTITLRQGVSTIATFTHAQGTISNSFTLFEQTLTSVQADSITDYNNLELTLVADCPVSCQNGAQNIDRLQVSLVQFEIVSPFAPTIESLDLISPSQIRVSWIIPQDTSEISKFIVERDNGTGFKVIASVIKTTSNFDDTNLPAKKIIKYRIISNFTNGGISNPSITIKGATPPTTTELRSFGTVLEPNPLNSFTTIERQIFAQTIENYNIPSNFVNLVINDMEINRLNAYQSIDKMNNGSYGVSQELKNAGAYYGTRYIEINNISQFLQKISDEIILARGGSNGTGNNPLHGVPPIGE